MIDALNPAITSATQWFERTLDDSANKRLSVPEGFLAIDGILDLCLNVVDGLVVYPKVIELSLIHIWLLFPAKRGKLLVIMRNRFCNVERGKQIEQVKKKQEKH